MTPLNQQEHVLITGTTSGLGYALMEHYVREGALVTAVNRRVVSETESRFPAVRFRCVDVRDAQKCGQLISELAAQGRLPTTVILNAGVNRVDNDVILDLEKFREAMETNLFGVVHFLAPIIALKKYPPGMKVVVVSSVTNYAGNPYCLGYYISKRAVTQMVDMLSAMYGKTSLCLKCLVLGPVPTGIKTSDDKFPKAMVLIKNLFSVSVEKAALRVAQFAKSNRRFLVYPFKAYVLFQGMGFLQRMIPGFYKGQKTSDGCARGVG